MPPRHTTRLPACALLSIALLVAGVPLVGAEANTTSDPPEEADDDHATATLHVLVTARSQGHHGPVDDATVVVYAPNRTANGTSPEPVARATTDDGWARFELAHGHYGVRASDGNLSGHARVHLDGDQRVHVQLTHKDPRTTDRSDGANTLGVLVTEPGPEGPTPAPGVQVTVYELDRRGHTAKAQPVARETTDEHGKAVFHLPDGSYGIHASDGNRSAGERIELRDDRRVHLHLADDRPHRLNGPYHLGIAALEVTDRGLAPVAGATVTIERYGPPAHLNHTWEQVLVASTDAEGRVVETLPAGIYKATLTTEDGEEQVRHFGLFFDRWVRLYLGTPAAEEHREKGYSSNGTHAEAHAEAWAYAGSQGEPPSASWQAHERAQGDDRHEGEDGDDPGDDDRAAVIEQIAKIRRMLGGLFR